MSIRCLLALALSSACVVTSAPDKGDPDPDTEDEAIDTSVPPTDTGDTGTEDPDADMDGYPLSEDCDDTDPMVNPGALDVCDGIDNDCDGTEDDHGIVTLGGVNHATLDEALAAAVDGDTIWVCPGDHVISAQTLGTGSTTIVGVQGRDLTSISESTGATVFALFDTSALTLQGVAVRGSHNVDAAITVDDQAHLTLLEARVHDNVATGIAIVGRGAGVVVAADDTEVTDNDATGSDGGGIRADGAFEVTLTSSTVSDNVADQGGGLFASAPFDTGTITLTSTMIMGNTAETGGGLQVQAVTVQGDGLSGIQANVATLDGGGIASVEAPVSGVEIVGNSAARGGGFAALLVPEFFGHQMDPDLVDCSVIGNTADEGAGIFLDLEMRTRVEDSVVAGNVATTAGGGALMAGAQELRSVGSDWATAGSGDNAPDDVFVTVYSNSYSDVGTDFECGLFACYF